MNKHQLQCNDWVAARVGQVWRHIRSCAVTLTNEISVMYGHWSRDLTRPLTYNTRSPCNCTWSFLPVAGEYCDHVTCHSQWENPIPWAIMWLVTCIVIAWFAANNRSRRTMDTGDVHLAQMMSTGHSWRPLDTVDVHRTQVTSTGHGRHPLDTVGVH